MRRLVYVSPVKALGEHRAGNVTDIQSSACPGACPSQTLIAAMRSARVRRLVYVSPVKALGERPREAALQPQDDRRPEDAYGQSKAEAAVLAACADGLIEPVIVRPVLVPGPGAKGNLQRLLGGRSRGPGPASGQRAARSGGRWRHPAGQGRGGAAPLRGSGG